jgi:hypothetical protein
MKEWDTEKKPVIRRPLKQPLEERNRADRLVVFTFTSFIFDFATVRGDKKNRVTLDESILYVMQVRAHQCQIRRAAEVDRSHEKSKQNLAQPICLIFFFSQLFYLKILFIYLFPIHDNLL